MTERPVLDPTWTSPIELNSEWELLSLEETHPNTRARIVRWCGWPLHTLKRSSIDDYRLVYGAEGVVVLSQSSRVGTRWGIREQWLAPMYGRIVDLAEGPQGTLAAVLEYPHSATVGYRFPGAVDALALGFGASGSSTCWDVMAGISAGMGPESGIGLRLRSILTEASYVRPALESMTESSIELVGPAGQVRSLPAMRESLLLRDGPTFTLRF